MHTFTQKINIVMDHPKFERRTFWALSSLIVVSIAIYGIFLGYTVVSVIERRVAESDIEKLATTVGVLETQYLTLSTNVDMTSAGTLGFVESKNTAYAIRGDDTTSVAFRP